jgi:hypothetical protein
MTPADPDRVRDRLQRAYGDAYSPYEGMGVVIWGCGCAVILGVLGASWLWHLFGR